MAPQQVLHRSPCRVSWGSLLPTAHGGSKLKFEQVAFSYDAGAQPVLKDIDLTVTAGKRIALVGSSGAGKTTIANLMLRFWDPQKGRITIDGRDLREITHDSLREQIALVVQDTYLFNATLGENILLARPNASEEDLISPYNGPRSKNLLNPCRRVLEPMSENGAYSFLAGNGSAYRSPGHFSRTHRS